MGRELGLIASLYYVRDRWYDPVAARFVSERSEVLTRREVARPAESG